MYTKDGVLLKPIADREDWVWSVKTKPKGKHLVRIRACVICCLSTLLACRLLAATMAALPCMAPCSLQCTVSTRTGTRSEHGKIAWKYSRQVLILGFLMVLCWRCQVRAPRHDDGRDHPAPDHGAEGAHQDARLRQEDRRVQVSSFIDF
jgi:hypothetical protein